MEYYSYFDFFQPFNNAIIILRSQVVQEMDSWFWSEFANP